MQFQNFTLDKFQEQAVHAIEKHHSVLVSAPTGSGKTLIADYIIDKFLKLKKRVVYTAPIKALSNQKYKDFTKQYGKDKIGLITGDVVRNSSAQILIMTTEVYRNMAIMKDPVLDHVAYCIMDEVHYVSDEERGYIWEESIIFSPKHTRFLFLSATIPNQDEFAQWVQSIKEHEVDVITHNIRAVPLERKFYDTELGITSLEKIRQAKQESPPIYEKIKGRYRKVRLPTPDYRNLVKELRNKNKLPCIYFVFSRAKTQEYAAKLAKKTNFLHPNEHRELARIVREHFQRLSPEVKSLKTTIELRQCLAKGTAFHNAGILPDLKHLVEKLFAKGLIKVLFATETFAVGINMPAKTVCFDSLRKYTGTGFRYLTSKEYFQISGRAGRRGIDKSGLSVAVIMRDTSDFNQIANFTQKDTLPLLSQFQLTYNTVLNMVNMHTTQEIQKILRMNFYTYQKTKDKNKRVLGSIKARFTKIEKTLTRLGYIQDERLTELGMFTSKIFGNELEISQLFYSNQPMDEYTILLLIAAITYEPRRGIRFHRLFKTKQYQKVSDFVYNHDVLKRGKWTGNIDKMTALIDPCFHGQDFIKILKNTTMPEGDLIRFFTRIRDKLDQVEKALQDYDTRQKVRNCKQVIKRVMEGIEVI